MEEPSEDGGGPSLALASPDAAPSVPRPLPPPSPLTGCYLLIVLGEPHSEKHKEVILQRLAAGLQSWDASVCHVDLERELETLSLSQPEGEQARFGERLIQYATENLVTEVLIHPQLNTLHQCMKNLLSSFTKHRHIIHAGYTFKGNGSWILQDGTLSISDIIESLHETEVVRVLKAYENTVSIHIHCAEEGQWTTQRFQKEAVSKLSNVIVNPPAVLAGESVHIAAFLDYLSPYLIPTNLQALLQPTDVVGNIRFTHPTLYIFPGGQGDAALFGINGFNMLVDGGFGRKACFWDFARHLDRLDAVLMTRLNNSTVSGIASVLRRKKMDHVYPQIGHFFCNLQDRKIPLSPDLGKDEDSLVVSLAEEGQEIVTNLRHLALKPHPCYRDGHQVDPVNLYHKVGHGKLDMYVISPARDSKVVKEFLAKWTAEDSELFSNSTRKLGGKGFDFPIQNLVSICALLVWQPANPNDNITRILFPGSTPQEKVFEGLEKLRHLEFLKHAVCSARSISPSTSIAPIVKKEKPIAKVKPAPLLQKQKQSKPKSPKKEQKIQKVDTNKITDDTKYENISDEKNLILGDKIENLDKAIKKLEKEVGVEKIVAEMEKREIIEAEVKKLDSIDGELKMLDKSEKEVKKLEKIEDSKKIVHKSKYDMRNVKSKVDSRAPSKSVERKKTTDKLEKKESDTKPEGSSPTTPKKALINGSGTKVDKAKVPPTPRAVKTSPTSTPAKSTKEANNRKVLEARITSKTSSTSTVSKTVHKSAKKEEVSVNQAAKQDRRPISRRTKPSSPASRDVGSPGKSSTTASKPNSLPKKIKKKLPIDLLEKTATDSTASTPSADGETNLGKARAVDRKVKRAHEAKTEVADKQATFDDTALDLEPVIKETVETDREAVNDAITMNGVVQKESLNVTIIQESSNIPSVEGEEEEEYLIVTKEVVSVVEEGIAKDEADSFQEEFETKDETEGEGEIKKLLRDEEDSEKKRKLMETNESAVHKDSKMEEITDSVGSKEILSEKVSPDHTKECISDKPSSPKEMKACDPDEGVDVKETGSKEHTQPDEKFSTTVETSATTAPTLPEDEKVPPEALIEEEKGDEEVPALVVEKYIKEETKENIPQVKQDRPEQPSTLPHVSPPGVTVPYEPARTKIHPRDIVKTPDEVADLPVHEEVDPTLYTSGEYTRDLQPSEEAKKHESMDELRIDAKSQENIGPAGLADNADVIDDEGNLVIKTGATTEGSIPEPPKEYDAKINEEIGKLIPRNEISSPNEQLPQDPNIKENPVYLPQSERGEVALSKGQEPVKSTPTKISPPESPKEKQSLEIISICIDQHAEKSKEASLQSPIAKIETASDEASPAEMGNISQLHQEPKKISPDVSPTKKETPSLSGKVSPIEQIEERSNEECSADEENISPLRDHTSENVQSAKISPAESPTMKEPPCISAKVSPIEQIEQRSKEASSTGVENISPLRDHESENVPSTKISPAESPTKKESPCVSGKASHIEETEEKTPIKTETASDEYQNQEFEKKLSVESPKKKETPCVSGKASPIEETEEKTPIKTETASEEYQNQEFEKILSVESPKKKETPCVSGKASPIEQIEERCKEASPDKVENISPLRDQESETVSSAKILPFESLAQKETSSVSEKVSPIEQTAELSMKASSADEGKISLLSAQESEDVSSRKTTPVESPAKKEPPHGNGKVSPIEQIEEKSKEASSAEVEKMSPLRDQPSEKIPSAKISPVDSPTKKSTPSVIGKVSPIEQTEEKSKEVSSAEVEKMSPLRDQPSEKISSAKISPVDSPTKKSTPSVSGKVSPIEQTEEKAKEASSAEVEKMSPLRDQPSEKIPSAKISPVDSPTKKSTPSVSGKVSPIEQTEEKSKEVSSADVEKMSPLRDQPSEKIPPAKISPVDSPTKKSTPSVSGKVSPIEQTEEKSKEVSSAEVEKMSPLRDQPSEKIPSAKISPVDSPTKKSTPSVSGKVSPIEQTEEKAKEASSAEVEKMSPLRDQPSEKIPSAEISPVDSPTKKSTPSVSGKVSPIEQTDGRFNETPIAEAGNISPIRDQQSEDVSSKKISPVESPARKETPCVNGKVSPIEQAEELFTSSVDAGNIAPLRDQELENVPSAKISLVESPARNETLSVSGKVSPVEQIEEKSKEESSVETGEISPLRDQTEKMPSEKISPADSPINKTTPHVSSEVSSNAQIDDTVKETSSAEAGKVSPLRNQESENVSSAKLSLAESSARKGTPPVSGKVSPVEPIEEKFKGASSADAEKMSPLRDHEPQTVPSTKLSPAESPTKKVTPCTSGKVSPNEQTEEKSPVKIATASDEASPVEPENISQLDQVCEKILSAESATEIETLSVVGEVSPVEFTEGTTKEPSAETENISLLRDQESENLSSTKISPIESPARKETTHLSGIVPPIEQTEERSPDKSPTPKVSSAFDEASLDEKGNISQLQEHQSVKVSSAKLSPVNSPTKKDTDSVVAPIRSEEVSVENETSLGSKFSPIEQSEEKSKETSSPVQENELNQVPPPESPTKKETPSASGKVSPVEQSKEKPNDASPVKSPTAKICPTLDEVSSVAAGKISPIHEQESEKVSSAKISPVESPTKKETPSVSGKVSPVEQSKEKPNDASPVKFPTAKISPTLDEASSVHAGTISPLQEQESEKLSSAEISPVASPTKKETPSASGKVSPVEQSKEKPNDASPVKSPTAKICPTLDEVSSVAAGKISPIHEQESEKVSSAKISPVESPTKKETPSVSGKVSPIEHSKEKLNDASPATSPTAKISPTLDEASSVEAGTISPLQDQESEKVSSAKISPVESPTKKDTASVSGNVFPVEQSKEKPNDASPAKSPTAKISPTLDDESSVEAGKVSSAQISPVKSPAKKETSSESGKASPIEQTEENFNEASPIESPTGKIILASPEMETMSLLQESESEKLPSGKMSPVDAPYKEKAAINEPSPLESGKDSPSPELISEKFTCQASPVASLTRKDAPSERGNGSSDTSPIKSPIGKIVTVLDETTLVETGNVLPVQEQDLKQLVSGKISHVDSPTKNDAPISDTIPFASGKESQSIDLIYEDATTKKISPTESPKKIETPLGSGEMPPSHDRLTEMSKDTASVDTGKISKISLEHEVDSEIAASAEISSAGSPTIKEAPIGEAAPFVRCEDSHSRELISDDARAKQISPVDSETKKETPPASGKLSPSIDEHGGKKPSPVQSPVVSGKVSPVEQLIERTVSPVQPLLVSGKVSPIGQPTEKSKCASPIPSPTLHSDKLASGKISSIDSLTKQEAPISSTTAHARGIDSPTLELISEPEKVSLTECPIMKETPSVSGKTTPSRDQHEEYEASPILSPTMKISTDDVIDASLIKTSSTSPSQDHDSEKLEHGTISPVDSPKDTSPLCSGKVSPTPELISADFSATLEKDNALAAEHEKSHADSPINKDAPVSDSTPYVRDKGIDDISSVGAANVTSSQDNLEGSVFDSLANKGASISDIAPFGRGEYSTPLEFKSDNFSSPKIPPSESPTKKGTDVVDTTPPFEEKAENGMNHEISAADSSTNIEILSINGKVLPSFEENAEITQELGQDSKKVTSPNIAPDYSAAMEEVIDLNSPRCISQLETQIPSIESQIIKHFPDTLVESSVKSETREGGSGGDSSSVVLKSVIATSEMLMTIEPTTKHESPATDGQLSPSNQQLIEKHEEEPPVHVGTARDGDIATSAEMYKEMSPLQSPKTKQAQIMGEMFSNETEKKLTTVNGTSPCGSGKESPIVDESCHAVVNIQGSPPNEVLTVKSLSASSQDKIQTKENTQVIEVSPVVSGTISAEAETITGAGATRSLVIEKLTPSVMPPIESSKNNDDPIATSLSKSGKISPVDGINSGTSSPPIKSPKNDATDATETISIEMDSERESPHIVESSSSKIRTVSPPCPQQSGELTHSPPNESNLKLEGRAESENVSISTVKETVTFTTGSGEFSFSQAVESEKRKSLEISDFENKTAVTAERSETGDSNEDFITVSLLSDSVTQEADDIDITTSTTLVQDSVRAHAKDASGSVTALITEQFIHDSGKVDISSATTMSTPEKLCETSARSSVTCEEERAALYDLERKDQTVTEERTKTIVTESSVYQSSSQKAMTESETADVLEKGSLEISEKEKGVGILEYNQTNVTSTAESGTGSATITLKLQKDDLNAQMRENAERDDAISSVKRMLVTASSEDGGHETELCEQGSIKFDLSKHPSTSEKDAYDSDEDDDLGGGGAFSSLIKEAQKEYILQRSRKSSRNSPETVVDDEHVEAQRQTKVLKKTTSVSTHESKRSNNEGEVIVVKTIVTTEREEQLDGTIKVTTTTEILTSGGKANDKQVTVKIHIEKISSDSDDEIDGEYPISPNSTTSQAPGFDFDDYTREKAEEFAKEKIQTDVDSRKFSDPCQSNVTQGSTKSVEQNLINEESRRTSAASVISQEDLISRVESSRLDDFKGSSSSIELSPLKTTYITSQSATEEDTLMTSSFYGCLPTEELDRVCYTSEPEPSSSSMGKISSPIHELPESPPESPGASSLPVDSSFLPSEQIDFARAVDEHRSTRGEDLSKNLQQDSSKFAEKPSVDRSNEEKPEKDPIAGWGKPLGLPSPTRGKYKPLFTSGQNISTTSSLSTPSDNSENINNWGQPMSLPQPVPPVAQPENPPTQQMEPQLKETPTKKNPQIKKIPSSDNKASGTATPNRRSESPVKQAERRAKPVTPIYLDLTYVPHHGNSYYSNVEFFKRVRARYYVFSGIEPSKEVYNALLEAKQTWEEKDLEVTIIPTYDTDVLGYWVAENEEILTKHKIDLSPSASRCTINLQDHETSCSAYRLEF